MDHKKIDTIAALASAVGVLALAYFGWKSMINNTNTSAPSQAQASTQTMPYTAQPTITVGGSPASTTISFPMGAIPNPNIATQFPLFGYAAEPSQAAQLSNFQNLSYEEQNAILASLSNTSLASQQMDHAFSLQAQKTMSITPGVTAIKVGSGGLLGGLF